jgi:hypothetical protein
MPLTGQLIIGYDRVAAASTYRLSTIQSRITGGYSGNLRGRHGDLHLHFFGTATLSFGDGGVAQDGDVFEIDAPPFSLPLRNVLQTVAVPPTTVRNL